MKYKKKVCEICSAKDVSLDKHHIHSLCYNGSNKPFNLSFICPSCHRKVHEGTIILEGKYSSTGGIILVYRNKDEESITGDTDPPVWIISDQSNPSGKLSKLDKSNESSINRNDLQNGHLLESKSSLTSISKKELPHSEQPIFM